jgi:hypothetical protein
MAKLKQVIYHTKTDEDRRVYHTNDQCTEGAAITEENTVWRDQCEECKKLDRADIVAHSSLYATDAQTTDPSP